MINKRIWHNLNYLVKRLTSSGKTLAVLGIAAFIIRLLKVRVV